MTKFLSGSSEADRRLDRFELIAEIAAGGMATVYLARLSGAGGFQRFVAIKRLHPHLSGDPEFVEMFLDEARLAARLHHPNVVPILEIGESAQGYYLVMEYVEGDTLARTLARSAQAGRPLPPRIALRICLDAAAGLHAAHELKDDELNPLNIVHRDVSPQNILVGMDGSARITDFGVARASTRLSTTRAGQLKGKLAYMAPEQARGAVIDRRADVFAMGIVVWECLAQKRLFKGEGEAETLNRVLYDPIPQLQQANPDIAAPIAETVMKALARNVDDRWATSSDFGEALEKAARDAGMLASHKEVAAHLDSVIGTDVSAQRDAMRAWLARSEPSQRFSVPLVTPASSSSSQVLTRTEGAPSVSSVSSAILQVPGSSPSHTPAPPLAALELPARKRSRVWLGAGAAGVLLALGGIAAFSVRGNRFAPQAAATQAPPTVSTATPGPVQPSPSNAPVASAQPVEPEASAAAEAKSAEAHQPAHAHNAFTKPGGHSNVKPTATATAPQSTASPASTLDDISKNPYR